MLSINESFSNLQSLEQFKEWKKSHSDSYFSSAFLISDNPTWQIDFYNPKKDNITSFFLEDPIQIKEEKIFRKEKGEIGELDLEKIKISLEKAEEIVLNLVKEEYKGQDPSKKIIILQVIKKIIIWNITYLTTSFNLLNVKIDAVSGDIKEHKIDSVMKFKSDDLK